MPAAAVAVAATAAAPAAAAAAAVAAAAAAAAAGCRAGWGPFSGTHTVRGDQPAGPLPHDRWVPLCYCDMTSLRANSALRRR